jgi:hypothetical protein
VTPKNRAIVQAIPHQEKGGQTKAGNKRKIFTGAETAKVALVAVQGDKTITKPCAGKLYARFDEVA